MRCFVALWPADETRGQLSALAAQLHAMQPRARRMRAENLHLTLAFIGELVDARIDEVAAAIRAVPSESFDWVLNRVGYFPRARVVWAGADDDPRLTALATGVRARLDDLRVDYDRKAFAPHVTLLRDAAPRQWRTEIEPIGWPVVQPVLVLSLREQGTGAVVYRPLA